MAILEVPVTYGQGPITLVHHHFIRDSSGNFADDQTDFPVTNVTPSAVPILQSASINGNDITLTYNTTDLVFDWGGADPFFVAYLDGGPFSGAVQDESTYIDGNTVHVGLSSTALVGQEPFTITMSNIIRNSSGTFMDSVSSFPVTNVTIPAAPVLQSASVNSSVLTLTYNTTDLVLDWDQEPYLLLQLDGSGFSTQNGVEISGNTVVVNLNNAAIFGQSPFSLNINNLVKDSYDNFAEATTTFPVTNNTPSPTRTLYYDARNSEDWGDILNWWNDAGLSEQATSLPTDIDDVVVSAHVTSNTGDPASVNTATFNSGAYLVIELTVANGATFNTGSSNAGTVHGDATFLDYGYNDGGGDVTGLSTFMGHAINYGGISGSAEFNDSSKNLGGIGGSATFTGSAYDNSPVGSVAGSVSFTASNVTFTQNADEDWTVNSNPWGFAGITNWVFNDTSHVTGYLNATNVTFNDASYIADVGAVGVYDGTANFNNASRNDGTLNGTTGPGDSTLNFNGDYTESVGTITGTKTRYYNSSTTTIRDLTGWTVVADGADVDVSGATYDNTTHFSEVNGGHFIGLPDIIPPTLSMSSPASGTITSFSPSVSWGDSSTCEYNYDGESFLSLNCVSNGSDIPTPSLGAHTLTIRGTDSSSNAATTSVSFTYALQSSGGGSSGGGSGPSSWSSGGSSVSPIYATSTTPILNPLCPVGYTCIPTQGTTDTKPNPNTPHHIFKYDLSMGAKSLEVKYLQIFLNTHGFPVSTIGIGSSGHETTIFGFATQKALIKFQKANNIRPAIGFFKPLTRKVVNAI